MLVKSWDFIEVWLEDGYLGRYLGRFYIRIVKSF